MKVKIKATNLKLSVQEQESISDKITALLKYYNNIIEADVEIARTTFHHQKGNIFRAEVTMQVPGTTIRAEAETDMIEKSVNEAKDKLKVELIKYKETHGV